MEAAAQAQAMNPNSFMNMFKGRRRTKRPRTPSSPLTLTVISDEGGRISGGVTTSSSVVSSADWDRDLRRPPSEPAFTVSTEEEEDMAANCLILLAQGTATTICTSPLLQAYQPQKRPASTTAEPSVVAGAGVYECKTCNRSFPSFQALGGHRASHKKPKLQPPSGPLTTMPDYKNHVAQPLPLLSENDREDGPSLSLRIAIDHQSNKGVVKVSRSHECTICGSGFLSGQALGGHMRRHRAILTGSGGGRGDDAGYAQLAVEGDKMMLGLDLNLPAPVEEDQNHGEQNKFVFGSNDHRSLVFSASSLVDCHY